MELKDYVRILRAHWVGVLVLALLGLSAAAAYSATKPRIYQASATGFVSSGQSTDPSSSPITDASIGDTLAKSRVKSYVDIATSTATATDVVNALGLKVSPASLIGSIIVDQPLDTVVIKISARSETPVQAQHLADAWVKALAKEVRAVEGAPKAGQGLRVVPFVAAELPTTPVLPRTKLNLMLGLVLGLGLGFAYALVRHQFDRRLRSTEEVERTFGVPVMASIPRSSMRQGDGQVLALAVSADSPTSATGAAEAFRKLRTNLAFSNVDDPPRVIVVTSPKQADGKSTIAANLAAAIAVGGQRVTLVDGDLRRPTVAHSMGVDNGAGLTDVLVGTLKAEDLLQQHPDIPGLRILAAGRIPPNPSELLGSQAMNTLMRDLAQDGMVIIDAPPLLPVTDAAVLTRSCDGALIVISAGDTLDTELRAALANITAVHGRPLGVIFNRVSRRTSGGYYYYYGDYYAAEGRDKRSRFGLGKKSAKAAAEAPPVTHSEA